MTRTVLAALTLFALAGLPAAALPNAAAPSVSAERMPAPIFRNLTDNGTTKPNGAALDRRAGTSAALDRKSRDLHVLIATTICRGC